MIRDPEGLVTGVENPFRFIVSKDAFNNHIIPIQVVISAGNGFDYEDEGAPYLFNESFNLIVQRGRVLPSYIEEDLVMSKDDYWIALGPVLVPEGVSVVVTEGTQIQFHSKATWEELPATRIIVNGTLEVQGTAQNPVELFPDDLLEHFAVPIFSFSDLSDGNQPGIINLNYFKIINPHINSCKSIDIHVNPRKSKKIYTNS